MNQPTDRTLKNIGYYLLAFLAILIALYPLTYFVLDRNFGLLQSKDEALLLNVFWNIGFYTHILAGGLALLIGWIQFSQKMRIKQKRLHKLIGKTYVVLVILSGMAGIGIGFFATGGWIAKIGFITLGLIWLYTTAVGFSSAKTGDYLTHQKMMTYSYAACFAAVTLRIYLPLLIMLFGEFIPAYQVVAWLCWVPNLFFAYALNSKLRDSVSVEIGPV